MARAPDAGVKVTPREITEDTVRDVIALTVLPEQRHYVSSNAVSIAETHYYQQA